MGEGARFERVTLASGARAIREKRSGEVMHPAVGPWAEARALYVEQGRLADRLRDGTCEEPVRVWDVGLGGAANAAAALACAREVVASRALSDAAGGKSSEAAGGAVRQASDGVPIRAARRLELVSFERDIEPLELALADPEGFPFLVEWADAARALLRDGAWASAHARWTLRLGELPATLAVGGSPPELVFFDPFSPQTNPELWTPEAFCLLRARLREDGPGSLLLTYSASTRTRVSLLLGGFFAGVGRPIGHKQETTAAATRPDLLERPLDARWLERFARSNAREPWGAAVPGLAERISGHPQFLA